MSNHKDWPSRPVSQPRPGYFLARLIRNGPFIPARIIHEGGLWSAEINGEVFEASADPAMAPRVFTIWHSAQEISEVEFDHRMKALRAARPGDPIRSPREPINLVALPSIF